MTPVIVFVLGLAALVNSQFFPPFQPGPFMPHPLPFRSRVFPYVHSFHVGMPHYFHRNFRHAEYDPALSAHIQEMEGYNPESSLMASPVHDFSMRHNPSLPMMDEVASPNMLPPPMMRYDVPMSPPAPFYKK